MIKVEFKGRKHMKLIEMKHRNRRADNNWEHNKHKDVEDLKEKADFAWLIT